MGMLNTITNLLKKPTVAEARQALDRELDALEQNPTREGERRILRAREVLTVAEERERRAIERGKEQRVEEARRAREEKLARYREIVARLDSGARAGNFVPLVDRIARMHAQLASAYREAERELDAVQSSAIEAITLTEDLGADAIGVNDLDAHAETLLRKTGRVRFSLAAEIARATGATLRETSGPGAVHGFNQLAELLAKAE